MILRLTHHYRMEPLRPALLCLLAWLGFSSAVTASSRWEADIQKFESEDLEHPPVPGGILFTGSSSIRMWKSLNEDFPELNPLNRGFGGSEMVDLFEYFQRVILPYRPRHVLIYEGDNDLSKGKSPQKVLADFQSVVRLIHQRLPGTQVSFIAIKPSLSRWKLVDSIREANTLIQQFCNTECSLHYVDVFTPMLTPEGTPQPDLFIQDGLHMNAKGYAIWTRVVRDHLQLPEQQ